MKIGFFDTGLGGVTILRQVYNEINAEYIYMADTKNAPYGIKEIDYVRELTENCVKELISRGCEIIVIACNTATSAAISYLRNKYPNIIFVGAEPAIKPALEVADTKKIILTATSLTLKGDKLKKLIQDLNAEEKITLLPLDKLVEYADFDENIQYDLAYEYLESEFLKLKLEDYNGIVLGCTHFPLFKKEIKNIIGENIEIFDSAVGITNNLKNIINKNYENYQEKEKSIEVVLTNYLAEFEKKFFEVLENL